MKTYIINGFIVPVTNKEHVEIIDLFDSALKKISSHASGTEIEEAEQAYNKKIYDLYKAAFFKGTSKRIDCHFVIHTEGDRYVNKTL